MPVVDNCPNCARTRVNGWCPALCCEQYHYPEPRLVEPPKTRCEICSRLIVTQGAPAHSCAQDV